MEYVDVNIEESYEIVDNQDTREWIERFPKEKVLPGDIVLVRRKNSKTQTGISIYNETRENTMHGINAKMIKEIIDISMEAEDF